MKEHYHKWYSQYLGREFEMLVFGHSGVPVILFPSAKGRYYEAKDKGLIHSVEDLLNEGRIKIYCPDSYDSMSWYNYDIQPSERVLNHVAYEKLVLHDVIGFALFETNYTKVLIAGYDFGGYHAVNIALKHPDKFTSLLSIDGFYNIKRFIYGHYDEDCYFNNPPDFLPGLTDTTYLDNLKMMNFILSIQRYSKVVEENEYLVSLLKSKGISSMLKIVEESHDVWEFRRSAFRKGLSKLLSFSNL